jgi:hypothetical protein
VRDRDANSPEEDLRKGQRGSDLCAGYPAFSMRLPRAGETKLPDITILMELQTPRKNDGTMAEERKMKRVETYELLVHHAAGHDPDVQMIPREILKSIGMPVHFVVDVHLDPNALKAELPDAP